MDPEIGRGLIILLGIFSTVMMTLAVDETFEGWPNEDRFNRIRNTVRVLFVITGGYYLIPVILKLFWRILWQQ